MSDFSIYPTNPKIIGPHYIIDYGKYSGKTILEIFNIDINYCNWLLLQKSNIFKLGQASLLLIASVKYNNYKQNNIINFNEPFILKCKKHFGKDILEVFQNDPNYCKWLINRIPLCDKYYNEYYTIEKWVEYLNSKIEIVDNKLNTVENNLNTVENNLNTVEKTFKLFKEGHSLKKIAEIRKVQLTTIENHISICLKNGLIFEDEIDLPNNIKNIILEKISELNGNISKLKPIKDLCHPDITYTHIKYTIALMQ